MPAAILVRRSCTRCLEEKEPTDFHVSRAAVSGRCAVCKVCRKEIARAYADSPGGAAVLAAAKAKYRASNHGRAHERDHLRAYRKTPSGQAAFSRADKRRDQERVRARKAVYYAVKKGRLERQPCSVCRSSPSHAHHEDYAKPLDVTWLCPPCHHRLHKEHA